jgi:hypothetical protein
VQLADVCVRDTLERACAATTCPGEGAGTGISVVAGAHVGVERFRIEGSALCGVQVAYGLDPETGSRSVLGGTMDLYDGEVAFNVVCGANVQTEGFDVNRLMDNVLFHDNGQNLDMSELPVPDGAGSLPEE